MGDTIRLGQRDFTTERLTRNEARREFVQVFWEVCPEAARSLEALVVHASRGNEKLLSEQVHFWASFYNLDCDWFLDASRSRLQTVQGYAGVRFGESLETMARSLEPPPLPSMAAYSPLFGDRDTYLDLMAGLLEDYCHQIENEAHLQSTRTKLKKHFEWLVQYQCRGKRYAEIAHDYKLAPKSKKRVGNTVETAVKETAALIGLELRPSKKGR